MRSILFLLLLSGLIGCQEVPTTNVNTWLNPSPEDVVLSNPHFIIPVPTGNRNELRLEIGLNQSFLPTGYEVYTSTDGEEYRRLAQTPVSQNSPNLTVQLEELSLEHFFRVRVYRVFEDADTVFSRFTGNRITQEVYSFRTIVDDSSTTPGVSVFFRDNFFQNIPIDLGVRGSITDTLFLQRYTELWENQSSLNRHSFFVIEDERSGLGGELELFLRYAITNEEYTFEGTPQGGCIERQGTRVFEFIPRDFIQRDPPQVMLTRTSDCNFSEILFYSYPYNMPDSARLAGSFSGSEVLLPRKPISEQDSVYWIRAVVAGDTTEYSRVYD